MGQKAKRVVLGVTGSIAAVKAPEIVRELKKIGCVVKCVLTPEARHFVTPFVLSTLSGEKAVVDMFSSEDAHISHLQVAADADLFLVAPASAATLSRCARGMAEEMVSLVYLAATAPVLFAPAMHDTMWNHPATQENVEILKSRGAQFIGPETGELADGTSGIGRMSDPVQIVQAAQKILKK